MTLLLDLYVLMESLVAPTDLMNSLRRHVRGHVLRDN